MAAEIRWRVGNGPGRLAAAQQEVRRVLTAHGVAAPCLGQVMVIVDELASNILGHAWPDGAPHEFGLALSLRPDGTGLDLLLTFEDDGAAFDPTEPRELPQDLGLDDVPLGGLGLAIVRRTSDRFEYRRSEGMNRVLVGKHLGIAPG